MTEPEVGVQQHVPGGEVPVDQLQTLQVAHSYIRGDFVDGWELDNVTTFQDIRAPGDQTAQRWHVLEFVRFLVALEIIVWHGLVDLRRRIWVLMTRVGDGLKDPHLDEIERLEIVFEVPVLAQFLDEVEGRLLDADAEHLDEVRVVESLHHLGLGQEGLLLPLEVRLLPPLLVSQRLDGHLHPLAPHTAVHGAEISVTELHPQHQLLPGYIGGH